MTDKTELNDGHITELVDRIHIMQIMFEESISKHALTDYLKSELPEVDKIETLIFELYQKVGKYYTIDELPTCK